MSDGISHMTGERLTHKHWLMKGCPWQPVTKTVLPRQGGLDLIPGQGTKIPHAACSNPKRKKKKMLAAEMMLEQ